MFVRRKNSQECCNGILTGDSAGAEDRIKEIPMKRVPRAAQRNESRCSLLPQALSLP